MLMAFISVPVSLSFFINGLMLHTAIDLPEEIRAVTKEDRLRGYYDNFGVLHIEFDNSNKTK